MMLPVYLAVLMVYWPSVNTPLMRLTAVAGLITGLFNMAQWFGFNPQFWWMGVLHLPLVCLSASAACRTLRQPAQL